jgi:hypothetical protein
VLRAVRVSNYAANSFTIGPYAPKFADTQHGKDFLEQYAEAVTAASVRFQGTAGRVTATLTPKACFTYACNEEDVPAAKNALRSLI